MRPIIAKGRVIAAAFLMLCGSLSCQTRPEVVVHQSEHLSVVLRELPIGYPSLEPYPYSYPVPSKDVLRILESLTYKTVSFMPFLARHPRRVFTQHQAELLAPELSQALGEVRSPHVVTFSVADDVKPDRRTKGFAFVRHDELHLIIEDLQKPRYEGEPQPYQQDASRWELLPTDRQRHNTTRPGGKGVVTNWIITPLQ